MPFDPAQPSDHSTLSSQVVRNQLVSLRDLIDTIPVGPQGAPGTSVTGALVDAVTTVGALEPAAAGASFDGANVRFTFGIPRGPEGAPGGQGIQGIQGDAGPVGPVGPAFTSFVVDTVTTLSAGQPATVSTTFDGTSVRFSFAIPQGAQGPSDLSGTSSNSNAVSPLAMSVTDPPTFAQVQAIANKLDELIAALRR